MRISPKRKNIRPLFRAIAALLSASMIFAGCSISPQPLTSQEIEERAVLDLANMQAGQIEIGDNPITLYDAMARALKYNLDHRIKVMEEALAVQQLDLSHYDLLPQITTSAGYSYRSEYDGSTSQSLIDGSESLVASTSSEKDIRTSDISIMWNVLDFGVSYARAKQQADRVMIIEERRRKVIQNIIQDVRYAYWRAVSSERLINKMFALLERTKSALRHSRQIAQQRLQSPKESLEYQKALLENIRLLWEIIQGLTPAKIELASLMNLSPGTNYNLTNEDWSFPEIPSFNLPMQQMEQMALISRPELREEDYRSRISAEDVHKALLQMLPGISLDMGYNYDSNEFLYNNNWWNAGAIISQNIVNLVSGPKKIKAAESQVDVDGVRRQAVSMAIMVQVNLSYQRYGIAKKEYYVARHLDRVSKELSNQIGVEFQVGSANELEAIKSETSSLIALMRHYNSYAELQNSVGRLYNTLGIDLMPSQIESADLENLASSIEESVKKWQDKVNIESGKEPQLRIPGITSTSDQIDINDLFAEPKTESEEMAQQAATTPETKPAKSEENQPPITVAQLLDDEIEEEDYTDNAPPLTKREGDIAQDQTESTEVAKEVESPTLVSPKHQKTTVIMRQAKEESLEDTERDRMEIKMRSAELSKDILRHRLLEDSDVMPVTISLKSRGTQAPKWLKRERVQPLDEAIKISIRSPIAAPTISR